MSRLVDAALAFCMEPLDHDHEKEGCGVDRLCVRNVAAFAREQRLALLQSLLDEELNTHGGKSSAVGTWLRTRMEEEKARG